MNDTIDMDGQHGNDEIERRLRAYADARLSPSPAAVERMRSEIVARAAGAAAMRDVDRGSRPSEIGRWSWLFRSRRAAGALLAATMVVASSAAVFSATPGSPLYGTRQWIESLMVPGSNGGGMTAQLDELNVRLADARAAIAANDADALAGALTAFQNDVAVALVGAGDDPARLAQLESELAKHVAVLRSLEAGAPAAAVQALESAIAASSKAIGQIEAKVHPAAAHTPPPRVTPDHTPPPRATPSHPAQP